MSDIKTGGPAFPVDCYFENGKPTQGKQTGITTGMAMGMTLRDYFAAKALQGLLGYPHTTTDVDDFAQTAYRHADAMIKERNKGWKPCAWLNVAFAASEPLSR